MLIAIGTTHSTVILIAAALFAEFGSVSSGRVGAIVAPTVNVWTPGSRQRSVTAAAACLPAPVASASIASVCDAGEATPPAEADAVTASAASIGDDGPPFATANRTSTGAGTPISSSAGAPGAAGSEALRSATAIALTTLDEALFAGTGSSNAPSAPAAVVNSLGEPLRYTRFAGTRATTENVFSCPTPSGPAAQLTTPPAWAQPADADWNWRSAASLTSSATVSDGSGPLLRTLTV